jgi:hypothetical protein
MFLCCIYCMCWIEFLFLIFPLLLRLSPRSELGF